MNKDTVTRFSPDNLAEIFNLVISLQEDFDKKEEMLESLKSAGKDTFLTREDVEESLKDVGFSQFIINKVLEKYSPNLPGTLARCPDFSLARFGREPVKEAITHHQNIRIGMKDYTRADKMSLKVFDAFSYLSIAFFSGLCSFFVVLILFMFIPWSNFTFSWLWPAVWGFSGVFAGRCLHDSEKKRITGERDTKLLEAGKRINDAIQALPPLKLSPSSLVIFKDQGNYLIGTIQEVVEEFVTIRIDCEGRDMEPKSITVRFTDIVCTLVKGHPLKSSKDSFIPPQNINGLIAVEPAKGSGISPSVGFLGKARGTVFKVFSDQGLTCLSGEYYFSYMLEGDITVYPLGIFEGPGK